MASATISQPLGSPASAPPETSAPNDEEPRATVTEQPVESAASEAAPATALAPAITTSTNVAEAAVSVLPAPAAAPATAAAAASAAATASAEAATHPQGALVVPLPWPRRKLSTVEVRLCVGSIVCWILLLGAGVTVSTKKYIDLIDGPAAVGFFAGINAWFWILTCYTVTNVAALCCLAALIGAIGGGTQIDESEKSLAKTDLRTLYVSAIIRAFFIYVAILSGSIMFTDTKQFTDISLERYLKLAGLVSALSFAIGYNPALFASFFSRVSKFADGSPARTE